MVKSLFDILRKMCICVCLCPSVHLSYFINPWCPGVKWCNLVRS